MSEYRQPDAHIASHLRWGQLPLARPEVAHSGALFGRLASGLAACLGKRLPAELHSQREEPER